MVKTCDENTLTQLKSATTMMKKANQMTSGSSSGGSGGGGGGGDWSLSAQQQDSLKVKKAKEQMDKWQSMINTSPGNFTIAESYYYSIKPNGQTEYNKIKQKRAEDEAKSKVEEWKTEMSPILKDLTTKVAYYKSQFSYKTNVRSVYDSYNDKLTDLKNDIKKTTGEKNVDSRLATFYNYNTSIVNSVLYYIKILYWLFFIIMVVILIWKLQFRDVTMLAFPLLILLFPLFFEKGIHFRIPLINKYFTLTSIYDRVFKSFKHVKIDNIYLIFFTLIIGIIFLFNYVSTFPFNYE